MKRIKESNKKEFMVVFVSSIGSSTKYVNEKNYRDTESIYDEAWEEIEASQGDVGEIWIDDIDVMSGFDTKARIDWKDLLTDKKGILDPEMFKKVFEDDEFTIKYQFLKNRSYTDSDIDYDEVYVYDIGHENMEKGNFDSAYPSGWLDTYVEEYYPELKKQLEKANAESYFDWAKLVSDDEINGDFVSDTIGDYFVWMYHT